MMMRQAEDGTWGALVKADRERNVGMPMELISAEGYAERDGITREEYIIKVLRAERERRQAEDSISSDRVMLDMVIDAAHADGVTVVEYVLSGKLIPKIGRSRTWDISPDFLAKLLDRYQERIADGWEVNDGDNHVNVG